MPGTVPGFFLGSRPLRAHVETSHHVRAADDWVRSQLWVHCASLARPMSSDKWRCLFSKRVLRFSQHWCVCGMQARVKFKIV